jgi:hypothetical protein
VLAGVVDQKTQMAQDLPAPFGLRRAGVAGEIRLHKRQGQPVIEGDPPC